MFDSGITVYDFIEKIKEEADVAPIISDKSYLSWLNSTEQMLYGSIVKEEGIYETSSINQVELPIVIDGENSVRMEDITAVYAGSRLSIQLLLVTTANGLTFENTYFKENDTLCTHVGSDVDKLRIVYYRRPVIKTTSNWKSCNVMLPVEFIDLMAAKLRGEAYKLANEDSIAAKWLNDYNALLQDFGAWCALKNPKVGM